MDAYLAKMGVTDEARARLMGTVRQYDAEGQSTPLEGLPPSASDGGSLLFLFVFAQRRALSSVRAGLPKGAKNCLLAQAICVGGRLVMWALRLSYT